MGKYVGTGVLDESTEVPDFIVNFEHFSHLFLEFLLLTMNG